jgi:transposase
MQLTPGQAHDVPQAKSLIKGLPAKKVLADKAYDCNDFLQTLDEQGTTAVIPSKKNRKIKRVIDQQMYKFRNLAERLINRLKQFRRVATRYDKYARNYLAFAQLAAVMILLQ